MIPLHVLILHIYLAGIRAYAGGRRHEGTDTNIAVAHPQFELQTITGARCPQAFKAKSNGLCPIIKCGIAKIIKPIITSKAQAGTVAYFAHRSCVTQRTITNVITTSMTPKIPTLI